MYVTHIQEISWERSKILLVATFCFPTHRAPCTGYKVGRVNQTETALGAEIRLGTNKPKGKTSEDQGKDKILQRYVVLNMIQGTYLHFKNSTLYRVYTNGTLVDDELLTDEHAGHCISIREGTADETDAKTDDSFGICVLDSSTSEFSLSAFEDDICRTKLETMLRQLRPKEIVFTKVSLGLHFKFILIYVVSRGIFL